MTKFILAMSATAVLALSCENTEKEHVTQRYTHSDNIVSLNKSTASLDRMLVTSESMIEDMNKMNHNLEAIFQAVTGCESEQACEALKQKLAEEAEQKRNDHQ